MSVLVECAAQAFASAYVETGDLHRIGDWCGQWVQGREFGDALMRPMGVGEAFELLKGVEQVALIPDHCAVQQFAAAALYIHHFMIEFILGIRTPLSTTSIPASARTASNPRENLPSLSRIRNRSGTAGLRHVRRLTVLSGLVMRSTHRLAACEKWRRACLRLFHPASRNAAIRVLPID